MSDHVKTLNQLKKIASRVLHFARARNATQAEVHASIENGFTVMVRMGEVETVEYHRDKGVGITVYFGHRQGSVSTADTADHALEQAVEVACNIAKFTEPDECSGLADAELMVQSVSDLDLYHPWNITPEAAIQKALDCENYAREIDRRITNSEGVSIATHQACSAYANSHGFIGAVPTTQHSMHCTLIASDDGQMERDYDYTLALDANDLLPCEVIAKNTVEKAVKRLGARVIPTQKVPVIFKAEVAKSLLGTFISAISGNALYRKASFLCDCLGDQIFPDFVGIDERPHLLKGLGSAPFDAEGVTTTDKYFIEDGVLKSYVLGSYAARKLHRQTTGNAGGVHNLFINTSGMNLMQLLKKMDKGLLVTELMGQGVNMVTGDYSRGAFGFWVENGIIQYPVSGITIAGNLRDMFLKVLAVGNDVDRKSHIHAGSMLIEEMMVAGG